MRAMLFKTFAFCLKKALFIYAYVRTIYILYLDCTMMVAEVYKHFFQIKALLLQVKRIVMGHMV